MTDLISREAAKLIATNRESHAKGETARACRGIAVAIDMLPAHPPATPCPCTLIEQDDDCPIGQPSLICGVCDGTGNTTPDKVQALAAEMLRIASDLGEPEDPFSAWEKLQGGATQAPAVKVRALNWEDDCIGPDRAISAHNGFSRWAIITKFTGMNSVVYRRIVDGEVLDYDTLDAAKAAAQADYEARILAEIEPAQGDDDGVN